MVRRGHRDQGSGCSSSTRRSTGSPTTSRTASSAGGWRTPATGRSPATASGARRCRCGRATTRRTPASTSTAPSSRSRRDFGRLPRNHEGEPDLHRPYVDDLVRPNPDDPHRGQSTMRRVADVLDVWFDSGSMSFAQVHVPVRERGVVPAPLPGRLHRRVHRPDPRLVLHAAHPGHGALRPAGVRELHQPRHRARLRRQQDVEVAAQLPRRARGLRPRRRRRDALVPDVVADPARRQPGRHRAGHPRLGAPGADPAVEQLVLLPALRQRRRPGSGVRRLRRRPRPRTRWTATCWPSAATSSRR